MGSTISRFLVGLCVLAGSAVQGGHPSTAVASSTTEWADRHFGLGLKLGNALPFVGVDAIVRVVSHLTLEVQANYIEGPDGRVGYGLAPLARLELWDDRSTPFLAAGAIYGRIRKAALAIPLRGYLATAGWQVKLSTGLGVVAGVGIAYSMGAAVGSGAETLAGPRGRSTNFELGLRYLFF